MGIPDVLGDLVSHLSEKNYEQTLLDYRLWTKIGVTHGWISEKQLENDIKGNMKPHLVYQENSYELIHPTSHLLLQFITDVELNPVSSTHARLCHSSLHDFFADNSSLDLWPNARSNNKLREFYTNVNLLAHLVNLGHVGVEDVQDHILQSLTFRPIPHGHQLCSLLILLKIAGATFAAYVDPSLMARCLDVLKSAEFGSGIKTLAKVRVFFLKMTTGHGCRE